MTTDDQLLQLRADAASGIPEAQYRLGTALVARHEVEEAYTALSPPATPGTTARASKRRG